MARGKGEWTFSYSYRVIIWSLYILVVHDVHAFNIDDASPIVYSNSDQESQFGFTVALHRHGQENMLLVGAPRAQSSAFTESSGVERSGAIFKCPIDTSSPTSPFCSEIVIDTEGHKYQDGVQMTNASGQWLGSTLQTGGPDGSVVTCRPMYKRVRYSNSEIFDEDFQGGCFVSNNVFDTHESFEPCATPSTRLSYVEYRCEFGVSAAIRDEKIVYGATGSVHWRGKIWYNIPSSSDASVKYFHTSNSFRGVYYFGHAVALGDFIGDSELEYIISVPRQDNGFGQVFLHEYDATLERLSKAYYLEFSDGVLGSYFGHALLVSDLNNDGSEDFVVSAPLFTDPERNLDAAWEVGKIFIYYNNQQGGFQENPDTAVGEDPGCRYGYSLAALGDINRDGFNDLAVGAPFCRGGIDGRVYIYHGAGNNRPISLSPKQILSPESVGTPFKYFGFSISSGIDVDENLYHDLSVGAHGSQNAILFLTRAVVIPTAYISGSQSAIDLNDQNDLTPNGDPTTGFDVNTCFEYSGEGLPSVLGFSYEILLDSTRQPHTRRAFLKESTPSFKVNVTIEELSCTTHRAYIDPNILDKQTAIAMRLSYSLLGDNALTTVPPILSDSATTQVSSSIGLLRGCANETCFPDLAVSATTDATQLILGVPQAIFLNISVANNGEDSFLSTLEISEPDGINFVSMDRLTSGSFATCSYSSTRVRTCDIGNPIPASDMITLGVHYQSEDYSVFDDDLKINMTARSVDMEVNGAEIDNTATVAIPVYAKADLSLTGVANPERVILKEEDYPRYRNQSTEASIGPQITHDITLHNRGPSFIGATTIEILWPMRTPRERILMNITSVSMETGLECSISSSPGPEYPSQSIINNTINTTTLRADCDTLPECWLISCAVASIGPGDTTIVTIVTRVFADNALDGTHNFIDIVSTASVLVEGSIYSSGIQYSPHPMVDPLKIETQMDLQYRGQGTIIIEKTPLWIYLISALGGVIILIVLISILYKLGFFKRKQLTPDQQSLVRERRSTRKQGASEPSMSDDGEIEN